MEENVLNWDYVRHTTNGITPVMQGKLWGAINQDGELLIPPMWDFISWATKKGQFIVGKDGKNGVINLQNEFVIPLEWDYISFMQEYRNFHSEEELDMMYRVYKHSPKIQNTKEMDNLLSIYMDEEHTQGIVNDRGEILVEPIWYSASEISEGLVIVTKRMMQAGHRQTFYGVVDLRNQIIVEPIYDRILPFKDGLAWMKQGNKWGILKRDGSVLIKPEWHQLMELSCSYLYRANCHGCWGVLNNKGEIVVPFEWEFIRMQANGKIEGKKNKKWQVIYEIQ